MIAGALAVIGACIVGVALVVRAAEEATPVAAVAPLPEAATPSHTPAAAPAPTPPAPDLVSPEPVAPTPAAAVAPEAGLPRSPPAAALPSPQAPVAPDEAAPEPVADVAEPSPVPEPEPIPQPVVPAPLPAPTTTAAPQPSVSLAGVWTGKAAGQPINLNLSHSGGALSGAITLTSGTQSRREPISGSVRPDGTVQFRAGDLSFEGRITGGSLVGTYMRDGAKKPIPWTASR